MLLTTFQKQERVTYTGPRLVLPSATKTRKTLWQTNHAGRNMGPSLRSRYKSTVEAMEALWHTTSKEVTCAMPIPNGQSRAHGLFRAAWGSDEFPGNGYHSYRDKLRLCQSSYWHNQSKCLPFLWVFRLRRICRLHQIFILRERCSPAIYSRRIWRSSKIRQNGIVYRREGVLPHVPVYCFA